MASKRVCTVCCKQHAKYTCPRCHKVYCSAHCYKEHSQTCSESFYREQATDQLTATKAGPEQTRQMMEVLQRLHQHEQTAGHRFDGLSSDGSSDGSSSDSDSDADLDTASAAAPGHLRKISPALKQLLKRAEREGASFDVRPDDLTPDLIQELEALGLKGQLSQLVTPWDPWWLSDTAAALQLNTAGQAMVQDMQQIHQQALHPQQQPQQQSGNTRAQTNGISTSSCNNNSSLASAGSGQHSEGVPRPSDQPLPSLQQLAGKAHKPSPLLPWQLLQLLVAYAAVMRHFNGDPEVDGGWEAAQQLLLLAPPLVQAALAGGKQSGSSSSTQPPGTTSTAGQLEQGARQSVAGITPADSVRSACMQLLDAASALDEASNQGLMQHQLSAVAAAVGSSGSSALQPEHRALLQVAQADAVKLLQLGRPAVLLALTDSHRLMSDAKERVKQSLQQLVGQPKQRKALQQLRQCFGLAAQKLWYFMVWSNQQAPRVFQCLSDELEKEQQSQTAMSQPASGIELSESFNIVAESKPAGQVPVVVQTSNAARAVHPLKTVSIAEQTGVQPISGLYDLD